VALKKPTDVVLQALSASASSAPNTGGRQLEQLRQQQQQQQRTTTTATAIPTNDDNTNMITRFRLGTRAVSLNSELCAKRLSLQ